VNGINVTGVLIKWKRLHVAHHILQILVLLMKAQIYARVSAHRCLCNIQISCAESV